MSALKRFLQEYKAELILIPLIFLLDRISKILALKYLTQVYDVKVLPFFHLTYVENTGAAFGSFRDGNTGLALASVVILFFLVKWRKDILHLGAVARYGVLFIMAGALGNLYDRITLGFVVDYFNFIVWPVFNIADSFVCIGAALMVFALLKETRMKYKEIK